MKCEDCKFWDDTPGDLENNIGWCRIKSPVITWAFCAIQDTQFTADMIENMWETKAIWPETENDDWCGEFQAIGE